MSAPSLILDSDLVLILHELLPVQVLVGVYQLYAYGACLRVTDDIMRRSAYRFDDKN
jgi:hypothetical protein